VKYSTGTIEWFDNEQPLRYTHILQNKDFLAMADIIEIQQEHEFFGMDWYDPHCHATEILDAKYEKVLVDDVIDQLTHLNAQQSLTLDKWSISIPDYLLVPWESIHIEHSTLIWYQEQLQNIPDHTPFQ
jgi:hypothetical protein